MTTPQSALQELREALRSPVPTVDDFVFHLSSTLDALGIQQGKVVGAVAVGGSGAVKAIGRSMGSIQQALLHTAVPTFLHALDDRGRELLDTFFAPRPASQSATDAAIRTHIALAAYQTFSAQLSARPGLAPLPLVSRTYVLDVLDSLARNYRLEEIYGAIWSRVKDGAESSKEACSKQLMWEDMVRVLVSLPAKVGNVVGQWNVERWKGDIPERLQPKVYFDHLIAELEGLMHAEQAGEDGPARLRLLIERLAAVGLLVPKAIQTPSNAPSLLASLLPRLLSRLQYSQDPYKPGCLSKLFLSLPNSALNPFVDSLLSHLVLHMDHPPSIEPNATDNRILTGLHVLELLIGPAKVDAEAWDAVMASVASRKVLTRPTDAAEHARNRIIVSWVANGGEKALISFADTLLDKWTDAKWIRFSSFSSQFWVTHLVLLVLGRLRPYHPYLASTSTSGRFLMACQSYLAHPDGAVRRMGMLVAESLSASTIPDGPAEEEKDDTEELMKGLDLEGGAAKSTKPSGPRRLKFGGSMWDGQGEGREEARWLRSCIGLKDGGGDLPPIGSPEWMLGWHRVEEPTSGPGRGRSPSPRPYRPRPKTPEQRTKTKTKTKAKPKVVMLDEDDGMSGYSSPSASSSRSASPTPSYLEEVANDPTLALESTDKKKVQRPVYVPQLLALLRDKDNPDAIEMALSHGEALIRAKRSFGTEVTDSAVNLVSQLVGMNDPYNLDDFDTRRDALTRAVVACAPRQTAPYLAEQYFSNQYSLQQRSVMLTALAMAARELAGLHIPDPAPHTRRIDFPSKTLPIALHRQYISPADQVPQLANRQMNQIDMVSDEIRGILLSKGARRAEEVVPDIARQKKLRVGPTKSHAVAEEGSLAARQMAAAQVARAPKPVVPFGDVAAEFFILPLINLFWQHYQDTTARESRALASGTNYRGAGAGMILSPVALERFLLALGLLVHAARHAGVFLSVIVPETLELAVTIGSIHFTRPDDFMLEEAHAAHDGSKAEGQVVGPALELALVCLEGAMDMDQGRTLAMDKPELVMAAGEWAQGVFEVESRGGKVAQGQAREGKIKAAAAGVVIKVADIAEKWTRAGIFMRQ